MIEKVAGRALVGGIVCLGLPAAARVDVGRGALTPPPPAVQQTSDFEIVKVRRA